MRPLHGISVFFTDLFASYLDTIRKYPLGVFGSSVLFIALLGAFNSWECMLGWKVSEDFWSSLMLSGLTVIPVGVIAGLAYRLFRKWWIFILAVVVIFLTSGIYFYTPWGYSAAGWLKAPPLILVFLLASLLPSYWYGDGKFWFISFDRRILFRSILGYIFSTVFFAGLALGLAAINTLFQLDINEDWYAYMGFASMAIIFPGYIMSGLPWDHQDKYEKDYSKVTHYIARFLLIPFTAGYLLILYAYFARQLILGELPEDSWKALVKAFPRKIFRSKEEMDWASEEKIWLDSTFSVPKGQYMTLTSMVRSGNEFGPWTFNWGTRPEVVYTDDSSSEKILLKTKMDSLIALHPMYYRYGVDELPCVEVNQGDKFIKLCFTELEVRFVSGDTLYFPEEVVIWTNVKDGLRKSDD